ncbi:hypothetical protein NP284_36500 [Rhodopseudomonas pseudopalustris]|uniref:Transmembrane protein n=1 Tax=Rhodopseudomonas faecalis TaxID=99655 RepID=A0A318T8C3_9BRAD|nr:hypothetical protein [Rhodopseudomonas faecalis]PYE99936.1 hypothetical protein BJ122_13520 [Rhodopseudomonas faecalis]TAH64614.1 MAG: hypothetical protein EWM45_17760 [Rhodopseudomonas palustris]
MIRTLHPIAGITAFLTILSFWVSTVVVELGGDHQAIAAVKLGVLWGLLLLIPAIAVTGITGFKLGGASPHPGVAQKRRRMPLIALNGLLVLVPCAIVLQQRASAGQFDQIFNAVQAVELLAGAINLTLLGLSIRDGFRLTRRFGVGAA